jgi:hypothetical protein
MQICGMLIKATGATQLLRIEREGLLANLYGALSCRQVHLIPLDRDRVMFIDEEGKRKPHTANATATMHARESAAILDDDYIAGSAVILPARAVDQGQ